MKRAALRRLGALGVLAAVAAGCRPSPAGPIAPADPSPIPGQRVERFTERIDALYPPNAYAGVPFAVRFDGSSVIGVAGEGFSPACTVYFGDTPLATEFGSRASLTATVPGELIARERDFSVSVHDPAGGRSPNVTFSVLPPRPRGACPVIRELYPPSIPAGSAFNRRPDGSSTLGVAGEKFGPRSEVLFGGRELRTTYQGPGSLVAVVPAESTLRKGSVRVAIRDPECPASSSFAVFDVK